MWKYIIILLYCGCSNVLRYGAYSDGTHPTETTEAINKAMDDQGTVYLPKGIYAINSPLKLSGKTDLIGNESIIKADFNGCFITPKSVYDTTLDISIKNLIIEGNGKYDTSVYNGNPQENGIYFQAVKYFKKAVVENVTVKNVEGGGIQLKKFKQAEIRNCIVENSNFVAYTFVGWDMILENCKSYNTRMFLECEGIDSNTFLDMKRCSAYDLYYYGLKFYGPGSAAITDTYFSGNKDLPLNIGKDGRLCSMWISPYKIQKEGINEVIIKNYTVEHMRAGIYVYIPNTSLKLNKLVINNIKYIDIPIDFKPLIINGNIETLIQDNF